MIIKRPEIKDVRIIAQKYFSEDIKVEPVLKGCSTFVYRITTDHRTYYIRFLPEEGSFASEVLVHEKLSDLGMKVPKVLYFEEKNEITNLSLMILDEIPGDCIEDKSPEDNLKEILIEAGRELALLHTIPVNGFGWIDKKSHLMLKGEKLEFEDYFCEYLKYDLDQLRLYDFTEDEQNLIEKHMQAAASFVKVEDAVLVHGDFDISHIFHDSGNYSGIIDFGEVRGNTRLYDLAIFIGLYQDEKSYSYLLEGYSQISNLSEDDLYSIELIALSIIVRFLGKKVNHKYRNHWYKLAKRQLDRLETKRSVKTKMKLY
ncbi:MAG: aminoglycoside phosphotransferase family protein [Clostridiales bacterium]|nr:aminoglycoside phosphotransferase family protein [Clostridiales bacterium]